MKIQVGIIGIKCDCHNCKKEQTVQFKEGANGYLTIEDYWRYPNYEIVFDCSNCSHENIVHISSETIDTKMEEIKRISCLV